MRSLIAWIVASVFTLPGAALGQVLQPADLVGTWVIPRNGADWADSLRGKLLVEMLTLKADGAYLREVKVKEGDSLVAAWKKKTNDQEDRDPPFWKLAGDTLRFARKTTTNPLTYVVELKNGRLILWDWLIWDAGRRDEKCAESIYERFDASKPLVVPPPPPITIQPADLVGTWGGTFKTRMWGVVNDTLVIGADHSLKTTHVGPADDAHELGTWDLLPGDVLKGPLGNIQQVRIYLQDGKLVRCHYNYAVLNRVNP